MVYSAARHEVRLVCKPCGARLVSGLVVQTQETPEYMAKRLIRITNLMRAHLRRLQRYDAVTAQQVEQELLSALEELAPVVGFYASRKFLLQTLDLVMEYAETRPSPTHFATEAELRAMLRFMAQLETVLRHTQDAVELLDLRERADALSLTSGRRRHPDDNDDRYADRHQDKEVRTLTPADAAAVGIPPYQPPSN
jgi:hypothetical protein